MVPRTRRRTEARNSKMWKSGLSREESGRTPWLGMEVQPPGVQNQEELSAMDALCGGEREPTGGWVVRCEATWKPNPALFPPLCW